MRTKDRSAMQELIQQAKNKYNDRFDYTKVSGQLDALQTIICRKHGNFRQRMASHVRMARCVACNKENASKLIRTSADFAERATGVHGNRYDYTATKFVNFATKVEIGCRVPGHLPFWQSPGNHLKGNKCPTCTGRNIDTAEFIRRSRESHPNEVYDYSKAVYTKSTDKIIIGCPTHGLFTPMAAHHMQGIGCPKCKNCGKQPKTTAEFIEQARRVHTHNLYDYSDTVYTTSSSLVSIKCRLHGIFDQTASNHTRGARCPACGFEARLNKQRLTTETFIERAKKLHPNNEFDYSEVNYINHKCKVLIKHHKCGLTIEQSPRQHLYRGCPVCRPMEAHMRQRDTTESFVEKSKKVHGETYLYDCTIYNGNGNNLDVRCRKHGIFNIRANGHLNGNGCSNCKYKTESKLLEWLQIEFDPSNVQSQISFVGCKNYSSSRKYRYDFRVGNSIIELDGKQHFKQVSSWDSPEKTLATDTRKAYLATNPNGLNLNLIRIYQPWVAANSNNWQEQLYRAIVSHEHLRGQVIYIGGDVYDKHRDAYDAAINSYMSDSTTSSSDGNDTE